MPLVVEYAVGRGHLMGPFFISYISLGSALMYFPPHLCG